MTSPVSIIIVTGVLQEVQSAFMRMDVNGDGTLTKREMLASDEFTAEEIEAIFELGDVDGDGEIDMGEFVGIVLPEVGFLCQIVILLIL